MGTSTTTPTKRIQINQQTTNLTNKKHQRTNKESTSRQSEQLFDLLPSLEAALGPGHGGFSIAVMLRWAISLGF